MNYTQMGFEPVTFSATARAFAGPENAGLLLGRKAFGYDRSRCHFAPKLCSSTTEMFSVFPKTDRTSEAWRQFWIHR